MAKIENETEYEAATDLVAALSVNRPPPSRQALLGLMARLIAEYKARYLPWGPVQEKELASRLKHRQSMAEYRLMSAGETAAFASEAAILRTYDFQDYNPSSQDRERAKQELAKQKAGA